MLNYQRRTAYIEGISSILINSALFALKIWAGRASGSVAMVADAWHTLSDTATSLIVVFGAWIAGRPGDDEHPFGHGRAEIIGAVVIGTMLAIVGFTFLRESVRQLAEQNQLSFSFTAVSVFAVSVLLKEGLAQYAIRAGRKTGTRSLVADGWHHRSDAIASLIIVVGALAGRSLPWLDGVLGLVVSVLILYTAFGIVREAASPLMGESPDSRLESRVREVVSRCAPLVTDLHHAHVHVYGAHTELTVHGRVPGDMDVTAAHDIATRIELELGKRLGVEATVRLEPAGPKPVS